MTWRYEIRDADNRLVEIRGGFPTQEDALDTGERARRTMQDISPRRTLRVITGDDEAQGE